MSWNWFFGGAAVGLAAQKVRNKRKRAEILAQLQAQANSLQGRVISPTLAQEQWFSVQGAFAFGLPRNFVGGDRARWHGSPPSVLAVDETGTWLAVFQNQNLMMTLDAGLSPWIAVVQPEEFHALARHWGGTVVAGPEAIVVADEQAVWAVYSMIEQGHENRKWMVYTSHRGSTFEIVMQAPLLAAAADQSESLYQTEFRYIDAFWTALGSWQWADQQGAAPPTGQPAGLRSPDGKFWWDGARWQPL